MLLAIVRKALPSHLGLKRQRRSFQNLERAITVAKREGITS